jgi:hypothetical protein
VQELFDAGAISAAEALHHPSANIITRAIGAEGLELDKVTDRLLPGDRFLLSSDGLFKTLPERELADLLGADADAIANRLVIAAGRKNRAPAIPADLATTPRLRCLDHWCVRRAKLLLPRIGRFPSPSQFVTVFPAGGGMVNSAPATPLKPIIPAPSQDLPDRLPSAFTFITIMFFC